MTKHRHRWKVEDQTLRSGEILHGKRCRCGLWIRTDLFAGEEYIGGIPKWALNKQRSIEKGGVVPKFRVGDIVFVKPDGKKDQWSEDHSGIAVVLESSDISLDGEGDTDDYSGPPDYAVDFGPGVGYLAWIPQSRMKLVKGVL